MMKLEIDKEFASLIPPLSDDEYNQLELNLLAEGCRDRLLVWGDILIDGHNRLKICMKHNIPYEVAALDFADRDAAIKYIILNQFGRRNLSLGNRSLLALKLEPLYKAKAKENQQQSPGRGKKGLLNSANLYPIDTRKKIAEIAGVSPDTIAKVSRIVENGTPEQVERIKDGGKGNSVSAVYKEVQKTQAPDVGAPDESDVGGDALMEMDCGEAEQDAPDDFIESDGKEDNEDCYSEPRCQEDDLMRIKGYVAELKNPDLDRSFTTEMFLTEYEAFAGRFIRSIEAFGYEPYKETYPLLSDAEREMMAALSVSMIKAIQKQNTYIRNECK